MRVRILGPLEVTEGDRVLSVGGPKERAVLAMLAVHSGTAISDERLIDALWGDEPPRTAKKTLQNYVRRLRHVLSADLGESHVSIEYRGRGYGTELMKAVMDHPSLKGLRRFMLATGDAHGLYEKFGFTAPLRPETLMERYFPNIYVS